MKRSILFSIASLLLALTLFDAEARPVSPSKDTIVCPADGSPNERLAAKEVRRYVYLRSDPLLEAKPIASLPASGGLVAHWPFDDVRVERVEEVMVRGETHLPKERFNWVKEAVSGHEHELFGGYFETVTGVKGNALLLDGYTAHLSPNAEQTAYISGDFAVEAWIALGAYPKNTCPIVDHKRAVSDGYMDGYFFGLDALGRLVFNIATDSKEDVLYGKDRLPLNTWIHVAASYDPETGMTIYLNGELVGAHKPDAPFSYILPEQHPETAMIVAKSRTAVRPYGTIRPEGTMLSHTFIDGILDEVKVYDSALSAGDVAKSYHANKTDAAPQLPERVLPAGPKGAAPFGAINTTLRYYPSWDNPWQIKDAADVVVRFDETDCRFVFWHGTSYIPCWVTENGIWFNNGFNEGWNEHGSCEPMSDKRAIYSRVKVVESNDARVVVQWRYGLVDVTGTFAFEDPATGWGDWTDETYTVYPNMMGVRTDTLLSNAPRAEHEWQESMMVMGPGQRPDDVLHFEALTLANMKGESHTYSWEHEIPPDEPQDPKNANVQTVNTQSKYRPFSAIRPQDYQGSDIYAGEIRREVCVFPWWNHWPVAPRPTDGRYAMFEDRASHASLSHWFWDAYEVTDRSMTKIMLNGLTDKTAVEMLPLVRSWSNPPELTVEGDAFTAQGYDPTDMAFHVTATDDAQPLKAKIAASEKSPVVDPAFVVNNWGYAGATLTVDGKSLEPSKDFRVGHRERLEGTDLIVWFRHEASKPTVIELTPAD